MKLPLLQLAYMTVFKCTQRASFQFEQRVSFQYQHRAKFKHEQLAMLERDQLAAQEALTPHALASRFLVANSSTKECFLSLMYHLISQQLVRTVSDKQQNISMLEALFVAFQEALFFDAQGDNIYTRYYSANFKISFGQYSADGIQVDQKPTLRAFLPQLDSANCANDYLLACNL